MMMMDEAKSGVLVPLREVIYDCNQATFKVQAYRKKSSKDGLEILEHRARQAETLIPLHTKLFEKYRLKSMTKLMKNIVYCQLRYHCKVIEELSPVLESLYKIDHDNNKE